jgi:polar amino acid transport system permease protein
VADDLPPTDSPPPSMVRGPLLRSGPARSWFLGGITVAFGVAVLYVLGAVRLYNPPFVLQHLPQGLGPVATSLLFTNASFAIGFFLALPLAVTRAFGPQWWARGSRGSVRRSPRRALAEPFVRAAYAFATGYVAVIRGTPALVQVFLVYLVFVIQYPTLVLLGEPTAFWAGLVALTINTTGYQAEALRGGFQSVDASQVEGARAIGLRPGQIFVRITLPQSLRLVTLPLANEWISNFKTSTILSYITIVELYGWARSSIAYYLGRPLEAFVILTIFYLAINVTVSRTVTYLERRRRIPGLGSLLPELPTRRASALGTGPATAPPASSVDGV